MENELDAIGQDAGPIRKHRNRYIAHLDHATALGARDDPLPPLTGEMITAILGRMCDAYHRYALETYETDVSFALAGVGSAESLAKALERAEKWRQHEIRITKRGLEKRV